MKTIPMTKATMPLRDCVTALHRETWVVTDGNRAVAAVLPLDDTDMEAVAMAMSPELRQILERSQRRLEQEGGLTAEQVQQELGITAADLEAGWDECVTEALLKEPSGASIPRIAQLLEDEGVIISSDEIEAALSRLSGSGKVLQVGSNGDVATIFRLRG